MNSKEWLQSYQKNKMEIESRELAIAEMCSASQSITSQLSGAGGGGNKDPHKFDNYLINIERQRKQLKTLYRQQRLIEQAIDEVPASTQRTVLTYLYLCGYSVNACAERMHYDRHTIQRIRNKALEHIHVNT